jgi:hypothetical protein
MPPARTSLASANRGTRPFKPPSRISNGTANSATIRKSNSSMSNSARKSYGSSSKGNSTSQLSLDQSDQDSNVEDGDEDLEDDSLTITATSKRKSRGSIQPTTLTTPRRRSTAVAAGVEEDPLALIEDDADAPVIPRALLTRILFEGFEDKNMKITKDSMNVLELYTRIFVKEAIARSKEESKDQASRMGSGTTGINEDWLNVEDLEKIAPQLILDF